MPGEVRMMGFEPRQEPGRDRRLAFIELGPRTPGIQAHCG